MRSLTAVVTLGCLALVGCGGSGKGSSTAATSTTAGSTTEASTNTSAVSGSKIALLGACLKADRALVTMGDAFKHLPSLSELESGSAINSLNGAYKDIVAAEGALREVAATGNTQAAEAAHTYLNTTSSMKRGVLGLIGSVGSPSKAESAMSEILGPADEVSSDSKTLNEACTSSG
jgi:hypothetical protein